MFRVRVACFVLRSRILGFVFCISGLGFGGPGFELRVSCVVFRVSCLGFRVSYFAFRVPRFVFRVSCFGSCVSGVVFRVSVFESRFRASCFVFRVSSCGCGFRVYLGHTLGAQTLPLRNPHVDTPYPPAVGNP